MTKPPITQRGIFRWGTSNVLVPARNKAAFPEAFRTKSHLEYYASLFNSVEINRTFYKLPLPATMGKWAAQVPSAFRFTVKLWREITHVKELQYRPEDIDIFMRTVASVGVKKGCLLVQFPAGLNASHSDALGGLLGDIREAEQEIGLEGESAPWRIAVEFRSKDWYTGDTYQLLARYGATLVLHDMPLRGMDVLPGDMKADFVFSRYHGPKGDYRGSYSPSFLEKEAAAIYARLEEGKDVYAYFNNTAQGDAPNDALLLNQLIIAHQGG